MLTPGTQHPVLDGMEEEPEVSRRMTRKEVEDTGTIDLVKPGYGRALAEVDNSRAHGVMYTYAESLGHDPKKVIFLPKGAFASRDIFQRRREEAVVTIGELDMIVFGTRQGMRDLRTVIPPTVALSLSRNALKSGDPQFTQFFEGVRRRTKTAASIQLEGSEAMLSTHASMLSGPGQEKWLLKEYMRAEMKALRNLPEDADIALYEGATAAEYVIFALLSHAGKRTTKGAMQAHEFDLLMESAVELNYDLRRINIPYSDLSTTVIPPDTEVVYVSIPNNPTGLSLSGEEIQNFLRSLPVDIQAHEKIKPITVVLDLVGYDYVNDKNTFARELFDIVRGGSRHVIIVDSISKSEALAEQRIGFAWSNKPYFNEHLKRYELCHVSPLTVRAYKKQKERMKKTDFPCKSREYLESFHATLKEIVKLSKGNLKIYTPKSAGGRQPTGNYVIVGFKTEELADYYLDILREYGLQEEFVDTKGIVHQALRIIPPLRGTAHRRRKKMRKPAPGGKLQFIDDLRGMQYLDGKYIRLCASGPSFQLAALADAIGIY